jgi:hypothetical protein
MKGIFYTLGLTMLATIFLFLVIVMFQHNSFMQKDISNIALFDNMNNEIAYIENGYKNIVNSAVNITISENIVIFEEQLPNIKATKFFEFADTFKELVENNSAFDLNINISKIQNALPLYVYPVGVLYNHTNGFGGNSVALSNTSLVTAYEINMTASSDGTINVTWSAVSGPNALTITVSSGNETKTYSKSLDFSQQTTVTIKIGSSTDTINVGGIDFGKLTIQNNDISALVSRIKATFSTTQNMEVNFPENTVTITSQEARVTKTDAIRIA